MSLFLILTMFTSIAIGEDLCCDIPSQDTELSHSEQGSLSAHFCQPGPSSQDEDHDCHDCICCSHSHYMMSQSQMDDSLYTDEKVYNLTSLLPWKRPTLDGPFQPPRA